MRWLDGITDLMDISFGYEFEQALGVHERMWRVKNPVIAAPDKSTALALLKNFYVLEPTTEPGK